MKMGKLIQNILDSLKLTDEDDFDDEDDMDLREPRREPRREAARHSSVEREPQQPKRFDNRPIRTVSAPVKASSYEDEEEYEAPRKSRSQAAAERQQTNSRIVPLRPANRGLEVCIMKPTRFEDSQDVCDMLKNERAIIVNLEGLDLALAQRIMDFVSGAIYSLNAKIHQISGYVFCISPEKVDISGDYMEMIQQTGFEVPNLNRN